MKSMPYSPSDIYLAAALAVKGERHDKTTSEKGRITFHWIQEPDKARYLAGEYYARNLSLDARSYADEIRSLKTLCHNPISE